MIANHGDAPAIAEPLPEKPFRALSCQEEPGGATGNRTRVQGFAVLCVTTPPSRLDAWEAGMCAVFRAASTGEWTVDFKKCAAFPV